MRGSRQTLLSRIGFAAAGCVAVLGWAAGAARAQKVLNPTTSLGATLTSTSFDFAKGTSNERQGALSGLTVPLASGATIAADGSVTVPMATITYPPIPIPDYSGTYSPPIGGTVDYTVTNMSVQIVPTSDLTGSLNPFTGAASLDGQVYLKFDYKLTASYSGATSMYQPTNCTIGTPASPIDVPLTTGTTSPPAGTPNAPITGVPYSEADGSLGLVNNTLALPDSSGDCTPTVFGIALPFSVDQFVGLPSRSGYNTVAVSGRLNPIIHRGVIAALTPSPSSGVAPLAVNFSAAATQAPAGVSSYRFDFNGDGVTDQLGASPAGTFTFTKPGVYVARVTVTDTGGDSDTATTTVTVRPATPPVPTVTTGGRVTVRSHGGTITVDVGQLLHCPAGSAACVGQLTATTKSEGKVLTIGRAKLQLAGGAAAPVRFKLTRAGAALLKGHRQLRAKVALVVRVGSGTPTRFATTIMVRRPRRPAR
jgi:PKD repeat protein